MIQYRSAFPHDVTVVFHSRDNKQKQKYTEILHRKATQII